MMVKVRLLVPVLLVPVAFLAVSRKEAPAVPCLFTAALCIDELDPLCCQPLYGGETYQTNGGGDAVAVGSTQCAGKYRRAHSQGPCNIPIVQFCGGPIATTDCGDEY